MSMLGAFILGMLIGMTIVFGGMAIFVLLEDKNT